MSLTLYSTPSSKATPRPPRLFRIGRNGPGWTRAARATRVIVTAARECAPWQGPSAEQVADVIIDNLNRLDSRGRMVLATVFAELARTSNN
jgi:hypothetical protein